MSDRSWRDRYYGRRDALAGAGLVKAPVRETMSHEMAAAIELEQRAIERERATDERLTAELRATWHRRRVEALRPLVEEFGTEAVTRITRRADPGFTLPPELLDGEDEGTDGH